MEKPLIVLIIILFFMAGCLTSSEEWNQRGETLHVMGKYKEAVSAFDRAIAADPQNYKAWRNRGLSLALLGNVDESEASFARAIALNPRDIETFYSQAISRNATGNRTGALESLNRAISISPANRDEAIVLTEALLMQGNLLLLENKTEEAKKSFEMAHEVMMRTI